MAIEDKLTAWRILLFIVRLFFLYGTVVIDKDEGIVVVRVLLPF
jgi:hypothetical protein